MFFGLSLLIGLAVWMYYGRGKLGNHMAISLGLAACLCMLPLGIRFRLGYGAAVVTGLVVGTAVGILVVLYHSASLDQSPKWLYVIPFGVVGPLLAANAAHMSRLLQTTNDAPGP
jgi:hypothetical protein